MLQGPSQLTMRRAKRAQSLMACAAGELFHGLVRHPSNLDPDGSEEVLDRHLFQKVARLFVHCDPGRLQASPSRYSSVPTPVRLHVLPASVLVNQP